MSKNLYRINKKSDLDEIMKNHFLKPICIIFVSKIMDKKLYDEIAVTLKSLSTQLTYSMILIVDFNDFIDNLNFFAQVKENVPSMISYFKAKQIASCNEKENFIPQMISTMEQIHSSYVNKLINAFTQSSGQSVNSVNSVNSEQNIKNLNSQNNNIKIKNEEKEPNKEQEQEQEQEQELEQELEQEQNEEQEQEQDEEDEEDEDQDEERQNEDKDEDEEEQESDEEKQDEEKTKSNNNQLQDKLLKKNSPFDKLKEEYDDNTTESIRLKKEKLKEIKRLKEMLNRGI